jgi:hypothetical protein
VPIAVNGAVDEVVAFGILRDGAAVICMFVRSRPGASPAREFIASRARFVTRTVTLACAIASCAFSTAARADEPKAAPTPRDDASTRARPPTVNGAGTTTLALDDNLTPPDVEVPVAGAVLPPPQLTYVQFGVAFTAEFATEGTFCEDAQLNCILGPGGGIAGRVGWRGAGDWYFGGAYELSKQDPTKLFRLAILQQLRAEARRYFWHGLDTQPVIVVGAGLAGYGNEWAITTWGPCGFVGVGVETQSKSGPVIGMTLGYRPIYLQEFKDSSGQSHGPGIAHMVALELSLEAREPL